jgi:hypothetical protein
MQLAHLLRAKKASYGLEQIMGGLSSFDKKTEQFYTYSCTILPIQNFVTNKRDFVTLYQDKAGILWIGNSLRRH